MRLLIAALVSLAAVSVAAQVAVSNVDVQRLEEDVQQAGTELAAARGSRPAEGDALERELTEIAEDTIYFKVSVRRGDNVRRADFLAVRDRLEEVRGRIQALAGAAPPSAAPPPAAARRTPEGDIEVPVGTEFDAHLQTTLSSETAEVEDRFEATLVSDTPPGTTLMPAGSLLRGVVSSVDRAGRLDRSGRLTLAVDRVTVNGRTYTIRAVVTQALEGGGYREDAGRLGAGAGVGAVIGGLIGGVRGALTGILVGAGGVIAATPGQDVELPAGTVLRVRLDTPLILPD